MNYRSYPQNKTVWVSVFWTTLYKRITLINNRISCSELNVLKIIVIIIVLNI